MLTDSYMVSKLHRGDASLFHYGYLPVRRSWPQAAWLLAWLACLQLRIGWLVQLCVLVSLLAGWLAFLHRMLVRLLACWLCRRPKKVLSGGATA